MSDNTNGDPLMSAFEPDRVYYATGILLDAQDFRDEQTYHRGRLARALAYLHGSGTVAGLKVSYEPDANPPDDAPKPRGRIVVQPGLALDAYGRLIELSRCRSLRLGRWYGQQKAGELSEAFETIPAPPSGTAEFERTAAGDVEISDPPSGVVADVFIRFVACERGKTPALQSGPFDALDAVAPSRLRDCAEIEIRLKRAGSPPLPEPSWPDVSTEPDARRMRLAFRERVFSAWRDSAQPGGEVFLARVVIPAQAGLPPAPLAGKVAVHNEHRAFVWPADAPARWAGAQMWAK